MIVSAPGMGKFEITDHCSILSKSRLITSHPGVEEAVDIKGMPSIITNQRGDRYASFLPFDQLAEIIGSTEQTVWHWEDFGLATPSVQGAYMQVAQRRAIGPHSVPDCVSIVATTNDICHMAGAHSILETIRSRFTILHLEFSLDDWADWACGAGLPPWIIAWARSEPDCAFPEFKTSKELKQQPNPRNVAEVGRWDNLGVRDVEVWAGRIGEVAAKRAWSYCELAMQAPDPDQILADPDKFKIPDNKSILFCVLAALANRVDKDSFGAGLRFAKRLEKPMEVLFVRDSVRRKPDQIGSTKPFKTWTQDRDNLEIMGLS